MSNPRIINVEIIEDPEADDDKKITHQIGAEEVEVPTAIRMAVYRSGLCDYNTAKGLNLAQLFDLIEDLPRIS